MATPIPSTGFNTSLQYQAPLAYNAQAPVAPQQAAAVGAGGPTYASQPTGYYPAAQQPAAAPVQGQQAGTAAPGGGFLSDVGNAVQGAYNDVKDSLGSALGLLKNNRDKAADALAKNGVNQATGQTNEQVLRASRLADDAYTQMQQAQEKRDEKHDQLIQSIIQGM